MKLRSTLYLVCKQCTLSSYKVWYHLLTMELSVLRNYGQTPNKIMKNQGENENKKTTFHFNNTILMSLFTPMSIG